MALTDYAEDKILQHVFMNTAYTPPATIYVALFTTSPDDTGAGTEVTGGSYARQTVAFTLATGGAGQISNSAALTFPSMPACTVVAAALYDALTGGNMLAYDDLPVPVTYSAGDNATAAIGSFTFTLD